jgi:O-antigen/teichoic acid export membrane protein
MNAGSTTAESGAARFSRRVVLTMAARSGIAMCSLITGLIIAHTLGKNGLGVVATLAVVTLLAIQIAGLGLPSAITYVTARGEHSPRTVLMRSVLIALIAGTLAALIVIAAVWIRPALFGDVSVRLLTLTAIALPFQLMMSFSLALYLGLERIGAYNLLEVAIPTLVLGNAVVTLAVFDAGLDEFVLAGVILSAGVAGVALVHLFRSTRGDAAERHADGSLLSVMFSSGARFFVAMAAVSIILRGDLLLVNYFRGSGEAGVYAVATQWATLMHMMPNVISTLLFPRVAGTRDESGKVTCRVTRNSVVLMLALCLVAAPAAFAIPLLYGAGFSSATAQFLILLPGVFLLGIETILVQHFSGQGLPVAIPMLWVIALVMSLGLNVAFVPSYGAIAAATVSSLTYGLMFLLVALLFRRETGRTFSETFVASWPEIRGLLHPGSALRSGRANGGG